MRPAVDGPGRSPLAAAVLGSLFDSVGRRTMISATYAFSGVLIIVTEFIFLSGQLTATTQTLLWAVTFFASAAASAGYLTVSEIFPVETRALAIALFFYSVSTAVGGLGTPALFGRLID